ncbi:two-component regulator propeller domain-containing protein [Dyadobacter sp. CY312]|uniref:PorZ beta-propeller-like domain-containing protein n=1 Tax=Dyadobacter sp. CY312 TaxID=2907303 RepID=UPI001F32105E|nr:two-component regulator propeller domain-containing protein [Dyadobacter sp. CY312]MCE7041225.1 hypothetical protein [Dyadobacter sp. CY312]
MSKKSAKRMKPGTTMWVSASVMATILFVVLFKSPTASAQNIPIGAWESHFNYLSAHQLVQTKSRIFCASYNGLFSVNLAGTNPKVYGKQDGLADVGISSMAYEGATNTILLAYRNGNMDLLFLDENSELEHTESWPILQQATDLPDIKNISKIIFHNSNAYLATNFGIVTLDIKNRQVLENYRYIGFNGAEVQVKDIAFTPDSIFALTSQGLQVSSMQGSVNRQYFASWKTLTSPSPLISIASDNDVLYGGLFQKGVYQFSNGIWKTLLPSTSKHYALSNTDPGLSITLDNSYVLLSRSGETSSLGSALLLAPKKSLAISQKVVWIADSKSGLLSNTDGSLKPYSPAQKDTIISPRKDSVIIDQSGFSCARLPSYLGGGILVKNTTTNKERNLSTGIGNGALPSSVINSIAIDRDGYIWFASDKGVGYLFPDEALNGASTNAILPVYGQRKLFANEKCTAIAVEVGNRKWIGTRNGLYLFSSDGTELISHFTAANSPIPSNLITSLYFEPETGLLFIDTPNGMVSYRTNSSVAFENISNVTIFPNPVRPGYSGKVGIKGLTDDSTVKITQLSGRLVYETRSQGGLASWDLNDYTGKRASGGVYLIYITSQNGDQKIAGKLAIID